MFLINFLDFSMCVCMCVYIYKVFQILVMGGGGGVGGENFVGGGIFVLGEVNLRRADFDDLNLFRS